jgi:hypothetical protein
MLGSDELQPPDDDEEAGDRVKLIQDGLRHYIKHYEKSAIKIGGAPE